MALLPGALLDALMCPVCGGGFAGDGEPAGHGERPGDPRPAGPGAGGLRCVRGHTFDRARQGYVSLLTGAGAARTGSADTAPMVEARDAFLRAGHFAPLAGALAAAAARLCPRDGTVLEAGVGTGHYLAAVLDALPGAAGLGLDSSKFALRRAARAHPRAAAARCDLWQPLPVRSGAVDLLLNVFSPRNAAEYRRVLRPAGALLVVTPTSRHLAGLREGAGLLTVDAEKEQRLHRSLSEDFTRTETETLEHPLVLAEADALNLAAMGPSARHLSAEELARRVARLAADGPGPAGTLEVTASFTVSAYRPR